MTSIVNPLLRHVRNQRDLTRALDGRLQFSLMHGARAGNPARQNLAALGNERPDDLHVFVIDVVDLVRAELADFAASEQRAALALAFFAGFLVAAATST